MLPRQQQATKAVALGTALRGTSGGRRSRDGTAGSAPALAPAAGIASRNQINEEQRRGRVGSGREDALGDSVTRSPLRVSLSEVNTGKQLPPSLPLSLSLPSKPKKAVTA